MKLIDYIKETPEGEEITVWDNTYDIEVYFYNQSDDPWDAALLDFASKLDIVDITNDGVVTNMYDVIERNLDALDASELFVDDITTDEIMDDIESILAGYVSESWLEKFVSCIK